MGKIVPSASTSYHVSIDRFFYIHPNVAGVFIEQILKDIPRPFSNVNLIVSCFFERHIDQLTHVITALKNYNFNTLTLIIDPWQQDYYKLDIPTTYINFFILRVELDKLPTTWNYDQHKGLLLTGKLDKLNRIVLLKKLYNQQLLLPNKLVWTVPAMQQQLPKIKSILADTNETDAFLKYCETNATNDSLNVYSNNTVYSDDTRIPLTDKDSIDMFYQLSNYSIIAETYFVENEPVVTEKTYRTILNKHPFIMAGSAGTLTYLKNIGFRTFENYLPIPNYDSITDPNLRLAAIVTNVQAFPERLIQFKDAIEADIEYNYATLKTIAQSNRQQLENLYAIHKLNLSELNNKFVISGISGYMTVTELDNSIIEINKVTDRIRNEYWLAKYNQLKGADWPTLNSRDEFNQLPESIQQECIDDFNFDATTQIF